jgi:hypothetical protein
MTKFGAHGGQSRTFCWRRTCPQHDPPQPDDSPRASALGWVTRDPAKSGEVPLAVKPVVTELAHPVNRLPSDHVLETTLRHELVLARTSRQFIEAAQRFTLRSWLHHEAL